MITTIPDWQEEYNGSLPRNEIQEKPVGDGVFPPRRETEGEGMLRHRPASSHLFFTPSGPIKRHIRAPQWPQIPQRGLAAVPLCLCGKQKTRAASLRWLRYAGSTARLRAVLSVLSGAFVLSVLSALASLLSGVSGSGATGIAALLLRWLRPVRPVCPVRRVRPVRRVFGSRCAGSALLILRSFVRPLQGRNIRYALPRYALPRDSLRSSRG